METLSPQVVKERLSELDSRRLKAGARKKEIEGKLAHERDRLCVAESNRQCNVAALASAEDDAMRGYLEKD